MNQFEIADNSIEADAHDGTVAYVPPLQRTAGQPEPIAAHGGLSYMAFDRDGDAGTAVALDDALTEIASGESQRVNEMIENAPPGPIKTKWGIAFRSYDECVEYIRQSNSIKAPPGGVALPLPYTVYERPSYSVVPSNAIWRDPARAEVAAMLRQIGHWVCEAGSGRARRSNLLQRHPKINLVLVDIGMPRMSGAEVARRVQIMRPSLGTLFITGLAETAPPSRA